LQSLFPRVTIDVMSQGDTAEKTESSELPTPAATPLDRVIDEIRGDAARRPEQYAREAIVPKGGE
jgi:hypothetical protein